MKDGNVLVMFRVQVFHQKPGNTGAELVFQLYAVFSLVGVGGPFRNPVKCHCLSLVEPFNIGRLFDMASPC